MRIFRFSLITIFLLIVSLIHFSCRKHEKVDTSPGLELTFSTDTVFFDTIFPTIGSVTKRLIVYNQNENKVNISQILLYGGSGSNYSINVDGVPGYDASNIEISGKDSIFIFVKVTIDPHNKDIPYVVADSIKFETNGTIQQVKLVSWGREAIFHKSEILSGSNTWDSLRAHVIYGSVTVDTNGSLTIMPGTRVYFHKGAYLSVCSDAMLKVPGTIGHPVTFQGDRMDPFYRDLPGQWTGIFLEKGSKGHNLENVIIRNGVYGLLVDQPSNLSPPMLTMYNTIIRNMTASGIYGLGTSITGTNVVIDDCGVACLDLNFGGDYNFTQLTVGNYWYSSVRHTPSVYLSNYTYDTTGQKLFKPLAAVFGNAIIYGTNDEEIQLDSAAGYGFSYRFDHAILKTEMTLNPSRFINCMVNKDPLFVNTAEWNYSIDSLSPAIDQGTDLGVPFDIIGTPRSMPPDLGAYEWKKKN